MTLTYIYLLCISIFILSLRLMSSPKTAVQGGILSILGMCIAIFFDFFPLPQNALYIIITLTLGGIVGIFFGYTAKITKLPQMIAMFNGLGGCAAVFIAFGETDIFPECSAAIPLGCTIGSITFSGSLIAFLKLQEKIKIRIQKSNSIAATNFILFIITLSLGINFCLNNSFYNIIILALVAFVFGITIVLPVGGADMPIVISILNAFSGFASAAIGFAQENILMLAVGTIVGISGTILAYIMTKSMNTSVKNIFFQSKKLADTTLVGDKNAIAGSPRDAAFIMQNSQKVIIVPGFGMAAASAQHALKTMSDLLQNKFGVDVKYAIHPVAGRMPGHMNVLLAEADVDYKNVFAMEDINREFTTADVAYVIGANDITNPEAKNNPSSPLYGMPVLDVVSAKTIFFVKRSLGKGYSGAENPLFFAPNTYMLYGDAKKVTEEIDKYLEEESK
ncbi:MAG: NAD(P)(+) transhydrogenase (Re/Si-specific) subunit beta [Alphaproteobacteria bacterium]|nr:NAD(P)(+) transhydrogenase (Re/Si-specific) subunit beta [Alphaproteobacteria bacterium]